MDDYSWIDTWGMDPLDSMYYGDLVTFGDLPSFDYSTLDFPSFEDESNIFDFLGEGGGVGDSGWQINGVDVNTDWNPFNDWVEGTDYDFTGLSEGSDWLDTGILAPIYESGEYGTTGSNDALLSALMGQINGVDGAAKGASSNSLSKLLGMLTKGAGAVQGAARSPLGQLAMALATAMAKRKGISSFNKRNEDTASKAAATSQRGLGSNRTGLVNMNTTQRAPSEYVQPAPMITRNT